MKLLSRIFHLHALLVLLVVALSTLGGAHRFVDPADTAGSDYALAFGLELADICGDVDDKAGQQVCFACLLQMSMSLPDPAICVFPADLSLDHVAWIPQPPIQHTLTAEAVRPARAPPTV